MKAQALAQRAYGSSSQATKSPRGLEYEAIAQITHEIKRAASKKNEDFAALAQALHRNNQLWTILAASVADKENALPAELRAQIFYLAEFSKRQSAQVLAGSASVAPLLEVNSAILRGLNGRSIEQ